MRKQWRMSRGQEKRLALALSDRWLSMRPSQRMPSGHGCRAQGRGSVEKRGPRGQLDGRCRSRAPLSRREATWRQADQDLRAGKTVLAGEQLEGLSLREDVRSWCPLTRWAIPPHVRGWPSSTHPPLLLPWNFLLTLHSLQYPGFKSHHIPK